MVKIFKCFVAYVRPKSPLRNISGNGSRCDGSGVSSTDTACCKKEKELNAIKCCRDDPSRELWRGDRGRVATLVVGIATDPTCNDGATNSNGNKPPKEEFCDAKVEVRISDQRH